MAFFGHKIANFGDFRLYVEIFGSFLSLALKKNDVLKGPIWRYTCYQHNTTSKVEAKGSQEQNDFNNHQKEIMF